VQELAQFARATQNVGSTCVVIDGSKWRDEGCKHPTGSQTNSYNLTIVVEYICATTSCGRVLDSIAAQLSIDGPPCKGEGEHCWVRFDCCKGFACQGDSFMYCRK
jgi:hypothetical protein